MFITKSACNSNEDYIKGLVPLINKTSYKRYYFQARERPPAVKSPKIKDQPYLITKLSCNYRLKQLKLLPSIIMQKRTNG